MKKTTRLKLKFWKWLFFIADRHLETAYISYFREDHRIKILNVRYRISDYEKMINSDFESIIRRKIIGRLIEEIEPYIHITKSRSEISQHDIYDARINIIIEENKL